MNTKQRAYVMVTVATDELVGGALDYAVARSIAKPGQQIRLERGGVGNSWHHVSLQTPGYDTYHQFSPRRNLVSWGSLVVDYRISINEVGDGWEASMWWGVGNRVMATGETQLLASCRCIVRCLIGDQVEVPDILFQEMGKEPAGPLEVVQG